MKRGPKGPPFSYIQVRMWYFYMNLNELRKLAGLPYIVESVQPDRFVAYISGEDITDVDTIPVCLNASVGEITRYLSPQQLRALNSLENDGVFSLSDSLDSAFVNDVQDAKQSGARLEYISKEQFVARLIDLLNQY